MGQRCEVAGVGVGTVRMGRWVRVEIGGDGLVDVGGGEVGGEVEGAGERGVVGWFCCCCCCVSGFDGEGAERETVFVGIKVWFFKVFVSL